MNFFMLYLAAALYAIAGVCYLLNAKFGIIAFFTVSAVVMTVWLAWRVILPFMLP